MNNEEKRKFIIDLHSLSMKYRPWDEVHSFEEKKNLEDKLWIDYFNNFYNRVPKSLYKYRKITEKSIENFEKDNAWFSHPEDFNDTQDSTLNADIEFELEEYKDNPLELAKKFVFPIIKKTLDSKGIPYDKNVFESMIEEILKHYDKNGNISDNEIEKLLKEKCPQMYSQENINLLKEKSKLSLSKEVEDNTTGYLGYCDGLNDRIRSKILAYSLCEDGNDSAMWTHYADESKGFCIEYAIRPDTLLGQRVLLNLFPIYYGEKNEIKFMETLANSIASTNTIHGMNHDDYQKLFLSVFTKDNTYSFEKEWRVSYDEEIPGGNLQKFPFIKSIILGERMSKEDADYLIDIAKNKKIKIYQRKFNRNHSKILIEEIKY